MGQPFSANFAGTNQRQLQGSYFYRILPLVLQHFVSILSLVQK